MHIAIKEVSICCKYNNYYGGYTMSGYMGQYVIINLTTGKSTVKTLSDDFYKKYLAGYGLGAAIITQMQKPKINPLSPESMLGFCSGLLTGTGAYFAGRFMVVGKSP